MLVCLQNYLFEILEVVQILKENILENVIFLFLSILVAITANIESLLCDFMHEHVNMHICKQT